MLKSRLFYFLVALILVWNAPSVRTEGADIVIFYTSDTHGHIASDAETIGLDLISGIKSQTPYALLLDAGDFLMGTPLATQDKGKQVVGFMKKAGYFAAAVGNHEFDYGLEELLYRKQEAEAGPEPMRLLSANTKYGDGEPVFSAGAETVLNGVRVCVFGLTTRESSYLVTPPLIGSLVFDDVLDSARTAAAAQRAAGCEIVVALSHIGSMDEQPVTSIDLAELHGIDIVIDGHSHRVLDMHGPKGSMLVSSGAHGSLLGKLEISYDKQAGEIIHIRNSFIKPEDAVGYAPDQPLSQEIFSLIKQQERDLGQSVGVIGVSLSGSKNESRLEGTPLGNLFADAARAAYDSDIALVNGGGLRSGLEKGKISLRNLVTVLPYENDVVTLRITGREVVQALEHGFSALPEPSGAFPQVSGMLVRVDPAKPGGSRVVSVTLADGRPLETDKDYTLATVSYLALGGDAYSVLAGKRWIQSGLPFRDAAAKYFQKQDTVPVDLSERILFQ